jgi:hypothetical protein
VTTRGNRAAWIGANPLKSFVDFQTAFFSTLVLRILPQFSPYLSLSVQSSPHGGEYLVKVLLGAAILKIDFDRLCLGIKLGTFDEDVLQVLVPAANCFGPAIKPLL